MKKLKNKSLITLAVLAMAGAGLVACGPNKEEEPKVNQALADAAYYIDQIYQSDAGKLKTSDFDRISKYIDDQNREFTIDWSVAIVTSGAPATSVKVVAGKDKKDQDNANMSKIDIDEESEIEVEFTLSGVMHYGDESLNLQTLTLKMPKLHIADWDEYAAACAKSGSTAGDAKNTALSVEGIVTTIIGAANGNTTNALYVQDVSGKGAYYAYKFTEDPSTKVSIGQKVRISGETALYSGTFEILNPSITKVYEDAPVTVTPVDYTTKFATATALTDAALTSAQGLYVEIKDVEITDEDLTNGYFRFKKGSLESYVRISSSVCPISKTAQDAMKAAHLAKRGWIADVKGIINLFNGGFYLTPIDAEPFNFKSLPQLSDAEAVAFEKNALTTSLEITKDGDVTLRTAGVSYTDVAITWVSDKTNVATVASDNSKVTYTVQDETTEVKLTATISRGTASETKEFTVKVISDKSSIAAAIKAGLAVAEDNTKTEEEYLIIGTVESIKTAYSEQYNNVTFYVTDGTMKIQVYRYNLDDAKDIKVGDFIAIRGKVTKYKGETQVATFAKLDDYKSLADVLTLAVADNTTTAKFYASVKAITSAYSEQYNNITVTVTDGKDDISCYRLAGGADLAVGDWITVSGTPTDYNGKKQINAGGTYDKAVTFVEQQEEEEFVPTHAGTEADPYSVEDALGLAKTMGKSTSKKDPNTEVYVNTYVDVVEGYFKGVVTTEGTYNTKKFQQNFKISDAGSEGALLVYSANLNNDDRFYLNDEVVVYGFLMNYNGTIEVSNYVTYKDGGTAEKPGKVEDVNTRAVVASITAGKSSVTLGAHEGATVTGMPTEKVTNGTTVENIVVTADEGRTLKNVKINGNVITPVDGKYSFTVNGPVELTVVTEDADAAPVTTTDMTMSFAARAAETKSEIKQENALAYFKACLPEEKQDLLTAVTVSKIYDGNSSGGWKSGADSNGYIKTGTGSGAGILTLTFAEGTDINKVVVSAHAWNATATDTVAVNGSAAQAASTGAACEALTFELDEASNTITITCTNRCFIDSIVFAVIDK